MQNNFSKYQPIYDDYNNGDAQMRRNIRIALRHAIRDGNYNDAIIQVAVDLMSAKKLVKFCEKLLLGSQNENEFGERNKGGKLYQVRDILSHYDSIIQKNDGQQCIKDIMGLVVDYEVDLYNDFLLGKSICYHNVYLLNSIFNDVRVYRSDNKVYKEEQLNIDAMRDSCKSLKTKTEERAFEDCYNIYLEDFKHINEEKFWANYKALTTPSAKHQKKGTTGTRTETEAE